MQRSQTHQTDVSVSRTKKWLDELLDDPKVCTVYCVHSAEEISSIVKLER